MNHHIAGVNGPYHCWLSYSMFVEFSAAGMLCSCAAKPRRQWMCGLRLWFVTFILQCRIWTMNYSLISRIISCHVLCNLLRSLGVISSVPSYCVWCFGHIRGYSLVVNPPGRDWRSSAWCVEEPPRSWCIRVRSLYMTFCAWNYPLIVSLVSDGVVFRVVRSWLDVFGLLVPECWKCSCLPYLSVGSFVQRFLACTSLQNFVIDL